MIVLHPESHCVTSKRYDLDLGNKFEDQQAVLNADVFQKTSKLADLGYMFRLVCLVAGLQLFYLQCIDITTHLIYILVNKTDIVFSFNHLDQFKLNYGINM